MGEWDSCCLGGVVHQQPQRCRRRPRTGTRSTVAVPWTCFVALNGAPPFSGPSLPPLERMVRAQGGGGVKGRGGGARGGVAQGPRAEPIRRREGPARPEGVQSRGVIAWTSSWGGGGAGGVRSVRTAETRDIERDRSKERQAPRERLMRSRYLKDVCLRRGARWRQVWSLRRTQGTGPQPWALPLTSVDLTSPRVK